MRGLDSSFADNVIIFSEPEAYKKAPLNMTHVTGVSDLTSPGDTYSSTGGEY